MRSFLIFIAFVIIGAMLAFGAGQLVPTATQPPPTPTADPLFWEGCKTCDRQQQRIQATAAVP